MTYFTGGGQKCQRDMIKELKNNESTTCSFEHDKESGCLNSHVDTCVRNNNILNAVKGDISKLLLVLLYHCGNLNFRIQNINQFILGVVQCNPDHLSPIVNCWDDFRSTFQANSSDPSLCRKYAEAKQNCANISRQACGGICEFVPKDEYNPFCSNHTDPPGTSELFDCIRDLGCSVKVVFEEAKKCDNLGFQDFAKGPQDCSAELTKNTDCLRNNLISKCPNMNKKLQVFEDVVKTLRANMMTQRFFCSKVSALSKESLHRSVKNLANCKPEFFTDAEKCAEPFRKTYTDASTKKSSGVCNAFSDAKKCLNKAHQEFCTFDEDTEKAAMFGDENPFCEGGKDPLKSGADSASARAAILGLSVYRIAVYLVL